MTSPSAVSWSLPQNLANVVGQELDRWGSEGLVRRLWDRDASLWTGADESRWLGWLDIVAQMPLRLPELAQFAAEVRERHFTHALLLGMGGSSLGPEVIREAVGHLPGNPDLHVLDSTDPAQVASLERRVDLARTLFIVASKSGSTLEPNIFKKYFFERTRERFGDRAGDRWVAITDPGSAMQRTAERDGFWRIFFGMPDIGGRYSVLSAFGAVPAAVMGVDLERLFAGANDMARACGPDTPVRDNPGVSLGIVMGTLAREGRDKLTIVTSPRLYDFGAWLEQLVAESTGKNGKAIIPVDLEEIGPPDVYGEDRQFVFVRLEPEPDPVLDAKVTALKDAGHPVVVVRVPDVHALGAEFFRWEIATAVAGAILGINPFDQPDVEASKVATRALTDAYARKGALPEETPFLETQGLKLFANDANRRLLLARAGERPSLTDVLRAHIRRIDAGDYFALLAYLEMSPVHREPLQRMRHGVRDRCRVATCLGFGPRFLHSTGQAYKGGPNTGVFLQVTCDDAKDLPVPGASYTFGIVKAAQARGDLEVLNERDRRALRVHLGPDVARDLQTLASAWEAALRP